MYWTGTVQGPMTGFCKHDNNPSCSVMEKNFLACWKTYNFSRGIWSVELTFVRLFIMYNFSDCFRGICHTYPWSATYARCVSECYTFYKPQCTKYKILGVPKIHTKKLNIKKVTSFGLSVTILSEYKIMHENCIYFLLKIRLSSVIT